MDTVQLQYFVLELGQISLELQEELSLLSSLSPTRLQDSEIHSESTNSSTPSMRREGILVQNSGLATSQANSKKRACMNLSLGADLKRTNLSCFEDTLTVGLQVMYSQIK